MGGGGAAYLRGMSTFPWRRAHNTLPPRSIAWTAVQLLFNNFAITFKEISLTWLEPIKWFSAAYYAFEALSVVEFEGLKVRTQ